MKDNTCLLCEFEPKLVKDSLENEDWKGAINEEIEKIVKNKTWKLVPRPKEKNMIRTKWVFKKKMNEKCEVKVNKEILVCKEYTEEEGVDYGQTFPPVARLEGVRIFLAYASYKGFKVYQIDVKSEFLNEILEEEVYIEQPKGFFDPRKMNMVCRLHKDLYGLKQAPRAWYERLHNYLVKISFPRTNDNRNLYLKSEFESKILLAESFVDDIIFGGKYSMCKSFSNQMQKEFEMSIFVEIKFFVGFQFYQMKGGIYITQSKYVTKILKNFGMEDSRPFGTPMVTGHKFSKNDDSTKVNKYRSIIGKLQYVVHSR